jgi:simple sugar transport system ATP-binding protein
MLANNSEATGSTDSGGNNTARQREVLELYKIRKTFGKLVANDDISFKVYEGELVALLGENGAGKTTLMNILFGHLLPDAGQVVVFGREMELGFPRAAIAAGIGMVHQHFMLANNLTVLENVMVGTEPLSRAASDRTSGRRKLIALAEQFGLPIALDAYVGDLSVGERQRVEILKALYREARILILDEPTAVLAASETERLFATLRRMAQSGLSIIFISHKLGEVMEASDRVLVLRAGRIVAERWTRDTDQATLAELMVGRRVNRPVRQRSEPGRVMLAAEHLGFVEQGEVKLRNVNFAVRAGEVLGIVGVSGNGQAALGHVVCGIDLPTRGHLTLDGEAMESVSSRAWASFGVGRIPEDRHAEGIVGEMAIWENAVLERIGERRFSRLGLVNRKGARAFAADLIRRFDIRGGSVDQQARRLSGGNMQKLILGRNLAGSLRLIIANQPTRGLDEGAIASVHAELLSARASGAAILLISEDLNEVFALADRIQVIFKGSLSAPLFAEAADAKTLGLMMAGVYETAS